MTNHFWHAKSAGPYRLATELRNHGYRVKVVDFFGYWLQNPKDLFELLDSIIGDQTLFIGFSAVFYSKFRKTVKIESWNDLKDPPLDTWPLDEDKMAVYFAWIKKNWPNIKLVYGGILETSDIPDTLLHSMDFIIKGLADNTIVELAHHLSKKTALRYMKSKSQARLINHDMRAQTFDFPHSRIDYQVEDHVMPGEILPMETSRGCLFKCSFCDYPLIGRKKNDPEYHKKTKIMSEEFARNYAQFQTNKYFFVDDTFNESTNKIEQILQARNLSGVDIEFMAYIRIDLLNRYPEQMHLLKELGIKSCFLGLESLNPASARAIGKSTDIENVKKTIWKFKDICPDLTIMAGFIAGLPHDTADTIDKWSQWLFEKTCPVNSFRFMALDIRGFSSIAKDPASFGYTMSGDPTNHWYNQHWDHQQARKYSASIMQRAWESQRLGIAGFDYMGVQNMGFDPEQLQHLLKTPINQLDFDLLEQKRQQQWGLYRETLLNYEQKN